jgi:hypothetical protein
VGYLPGTVTSDVVATSGSEFDYGALREDGLVVWATDADLGS